MLDAASPEESGNDPVVAPTATPLGNARREKLSDSTLGNKQGKMNNTYR